ncbi:MAG: O-antigen ligase family protein [Omnitrophica bacterium]|nr:O-antigen ligase family protein [Candidatus Omnitrophota bacterium]
MLPLFLREYAVITGFIIIGSFIFRFFFNDRIFLRWGLLLFLVITALYCSRNFFLFTAILFVLVRKFVPKKPSIECLSYYFLLLPLVPENFAQKIPLPGLQQLFTLSYPLMLNIFILLPIFLNVFPYIKRTIFSQRCDKYIIIYLVYVFFLGFRDTTLTDAFRSGFYLFLGPFMLYFVVSRTISRAEDFAKLFKPMIFVAFILALMGIFNTIKGWNMYEALEFISEILATKRVGYLRRLGVLRAQASFSHPISFGTYLTLMIGFMMFLKDSFYEKKTQFHLVIGTLFFSMLFTLSRGPLLGFAVFFFIFIILMKQKAFKFTPIILALAFAFLFSPISNITLSTLPFVGERQQRTVEYRKKLWVNSIKVAKRSPLTGNNSYMEEPEIQELKKYGGVLITGGVDIVSSYLLILLQHGLIGLCLFLLIFLKLLFGILKAFFSTRDETLSLLGKMLFSITAATLVMMATVTYQSSYYLWCLFGFCAVYLQIIKGESRFLSRT